ncbi:MAG: L-threonylcarbamoyladenylate synthase [Cyanobacteria bacterium P01_F01_bin.150]
MAKVPLSRLIQAGQEGDRLLSFPTDTVPALACRPSFAGMIYRAKQRSQTKPLILMGGHANDLWSYVQWDHPAFPIWQQMSFWYWPGALTLVLPASDRLPAAVNPINPSTIGIRVPNCAIARHILNQTGPLATTSINRSGQPPLETLEEINQEFPKVLTLTQAELNKWTTLESASLMQSIQSVPDQASDQTSILQGLIAKPAQSRPKTGTPSTVIRWTDDGWKILRQGMLRII